MTNINVIQSFKDLANAVKDTDLYKDSIDNIDKAFEDNNLSGYEKTELRANFLANITNNAINNAMSSSLKIEVTKAKLDIEVQILNKDLAIKEQQRLAEQIKNGGISITYIYFKSYYNRAGEKIDTQYYTNDGVDTIEEEYTYIEIVDDVEVVTSGVVTHYYFEDIPRVKEKIVDLDGTMKSFYEVQRDASLKEIEVNNAKKNQFELYGKKEAMVNVGQAIGMMLTTEAPPPAAMVAMHKKLIEDVGEYTADTFEDYTTFDA